MSKPEVLSDKGGVTMYEIKMYALVKRSEYELENNQSPSNLYALGVEENSNQFEAGETRLLNPPNIYGSVGITMGIC